MQVTLPGQALFYHGLREAVRRDITSHTSKLMPASGSQQTLQITLSPWVGIQWDLNVIQHIISCCTLFVARHLALTAAFSHFVLCDNRLSSTRNGKSEFPLTVCS